VAKKRQRLQKISRQKAWLTRERERITKPWRLAVFKLRDQLADDCLSHPTELRRFQNRRLIENLHAELEQRRRRWDPGPAMMAYWLFCGSPWQDQLGYNEARQQHYAELKAVKLAREFQPRKLKKRAEADAFIIELPFRLDSLASWIEAQESWVFWRTLSSHPAAWDRHDAGARSQALAAGMIALLPTIFHGMSDWFIAEIIKDLRGWTKPQWVKILKAAARVAERGDQTLTEVDRWVWWRYPIFGRYHWSAAEVLRAAREKFGEIDDSLNEAAFQAAWVRRGLRFTGRKTSRKRPPLWDFVTNEPVPKNVSLMLPLLDWIPYEKSSSQT
jgi:hypothetical protein